MRGLKKSDNIRETTIYLILLIGIKTILFIYNTGIRHNNIWIFLITWSFSVVLILAFEFSMIKYKTLMQLILYILISFLIFADTMHYAYFQSLTSVSLFKQVSQVGAIGDSLKALLSLDKILLLLDIPFLIAYHRKGNKKVYSVTKNKSILSMVFLIVLSYSHLIGAEKLVAVGNQELYTYHLMDIKNMVKKDEGLNTEDLMVFKEFLEVEGEEIEEEVEIRHLGIGKDKNLILIQVEALQNFVINLEYEGQEVTPNLNKFIADQGSLYFDEYFQLIGRGNTSDAEFVTNNSLHPSMEEYAYLQYEDNTFYGLPWILRDNGYTSWVFHGYKKEFWNRDKAYIGQGFERFISEEDFTYEESIGFGISDREFFQETLEYLKELDSKDDNPFYSFLITLTSHTPYTMNSKYHVLEIKEEHKGNIVADYLQSIHYTDKYIGEFIENLKEEGLYENTVIGIYGDHFGINNANPEVFEPMKDILGVRYHYDHIMNVPLIIHVPGEEINETISQVGSQIDFYPTILNIMGIHNEKFMFGKDLVNYNGYNFVATQTMMRRGSFIDKDVIFIFSGDGIFNNSRAINRETREEVDIQPYREYYEKAIEEINMGNMILKKDLLATMDENNSELEAVDEDNLLDEFKEIKDYAHIENRDIGKYLEDNKILRIDLDHSRVGLQAIRNSLKEDMDTFLIVRSDTNVRDARESKYSRLRNIDSNFMLSNRYIAEVNDFEKYFFIQRDRFHNLILNVTGKAYEDLEIIDFLRTNKHIGIIIEEESLGEGLRSGLKDLNVNIFIEEEGNLIKVD